MIEFLAPRDGRRPPGGLSRCAGGCGTPRKHVELNGADGDPLGMPVRVRPNCLACFVQLIDVVGYDRRSARQGREPWGCPPWGAGSRPPLISDATGRDHATLRSRGPFPFTAAVLPIRRTPGRVLRRHAPAGWGRPSFGVVMHPMSGRIPALVAPAMVSVFSAEAATRDGPFSFGERRRRRSVWWEGCRRGSRESPGRRS
jgi:hypothetical protein